MELEKNSKLLDNECQLICPGIARILNIYRLKKDLPVCLLCTTKIDIFLTLLFFKSLLVK